MGVGCSEYAKSVRRGVGSPFAGCSSGNSGRGNGGGEMELRGELVVGDGGGDGDGKGGEVVGVGAE